MTTPQTLTREDITAHVEAYRSHLVKNYLGGPSVFAAEVMSDPESIAAEVVDFAADHRDADISYNWDVPHALRDAIYLAAGDWAREVTPATVTKPVRAADLPSLDYLAA